MSLLEVGDVELFHKTLELFVSEVRSQNAPYLLGAAMGHRKHGELAWQFIRDRWEELNTDLRDRSDKWRQSTQKYGLSTEFDPQNGGRYPLSIHSQTGR